MRGRPKKAEDEQQIRLDLMRAAAECLATQSYASVSIRQIAAKAGTTSAMISYYFGGKPGLVSALLESVFASSAIPANVMNTLQELPPEQRSGLLVDAFFSLAKENPWMIRMIVDDLVNQDAEIRKLLVETIAGTSDKIFTACIKLQVKDGYFRKDIDVKLAKTNLLSLMTFPLLAAPILKDAYKVDIEKMHQRKLVANIVETFEAALLKR
jgi:AcrR family transcriptional regulator